ncbi:MAG: OmpA family protein [Terriglobia bacterium]
MNGYKKSIELFAVALGALVIATAGCATKKYVNQSVQSGVQPLSVKMQKANQQIAQNSDQIKDVDQRSESGIGEARNSAQQANQAAGQADQHAQAANQLAQQGVSKADQAQETADNLDNYKAAQHSTVRFGLNRSTLTSEDKQSLDSLIQAVKPLKHYVIQVQGYTDTSGPKTYNIQLSQRRADTVVRYLTSNGEVPLVKIYNLGYGEAAPADSNHTRKGRAMNRRVDVTVLVPQLPGESASTQASSPNPGGTQ